MCWDKLSPLRIVSVDLDKTTLRVGSERRLEENDEQAISAYTLQQDF